MSRKIIVQVGDRFSRLVVVSRAEKRPGSTNPRFLCRCDCGTEKIIAKAELYKGKTTSCGCYRKDWMQKTFVKHGHAGHGSEGQSKVYMIWVEMIKRCHTSTHYRYEYYGARGITVCERWRSDFRSFLQDMGEPGPDMSIEREDVNGNYEPGNCKWATRAEQMNNVRSNVMLSTPDGLMTVAQFARRHGLKYFQVQKPVRRGITEIAGIKFEILGRRDSIRKQSS